MTASIRLTLKYCRPNSMLNSDYDSVNLPINPTKNKQKIIDCIKDYMKTWNGEGTLCIANASTNVYAEQYPSEDFFNSLSGRKWTFNNGKIREVKR